MARPKSPVTARAKRELATAHIRASYDFAVTCPLPEGMTRAEAIEQIKEAFRISQGQRISEADRAEPARPVPVPGTTSR